MNHYIAVLLSLSPLAFLAFMLWILYRWDVKSAAKKARADALAEAEQALLRPAFVAFSAWEYDRSLPAVERRERYSRGKRYARAAQIIASIPKDRV